MRLRKPCEHDLYDEHPQWVGFPPTELETCPGGEFLPEDAELIERIAKHLSESIGTRNVKRRPEEWKVVAAAALDALADQVGEPR